MEWKRKCRSSHSKSQTALKFPYVDTIIETGAMKTNSCRKPVSMRSYTAAVSWMLELSVTGLSTSKMVTCPLYRIESIDYKRIYLAVVVIVHRGAAESDYDYGQQSPLS